MPNVGSSAQCGQFCPMWAVLPNVGSSKKMPNVGSSKEMSNVGSSIEMPNVGSSIDMS